MLDPYRVPPVLPPTPRGTFRAPRHVLGLAQRVLLVAALAFCLGVVGLAVLEGCTPKQQEVAARVAAPVVRASCVVLRAALDDGTINELCATAADLVPLLEEIVRARNKGEVVPPPASAPLLAVALDPPPATARRAPRRRCVSYAPVESSKDDGGGVPLDAGDAGRGGGR